MNRRVCTPVCACFTASASRFETKNEKSIKSLPVEWPRKISFNQSPLVRATLYFTPNTHLPRSPRLGNVQWPFGHARSTARRWMGVAPRRVDQAGPSGPISNSFASLFKPLSHFAPRHPLLSSPTLCNGDTSQRTRELIEKHPNLYVQDRRHNGRGPVQNVAEINQP